MNKRILLFAGLCGVGVLLFAAASRSEIKPPVTPKYNTGLAANETRNSAFGKEFPLHYDSYRLNDQSDEKTMTRFKGSIPFRKNDNVNPLPKGFKQAAQPYLKNLWLGYPFSFEYNEARGHTHGIRDILEIDRINNYSDNAGLPATCWNCKTPKIPEWVAEYGDDKFWSMNFHDFRTTDKISMGDQTIGCANCHDPKTMELVITSIPLKEALAEQGIDWTKATRNEMRGYVCGQCHVEYYFMEKDHGPNKKPKFPWANGKNPDDMYEYYMDKGPKNAQGGFDSFADWTHPVSKTRMLKAQHPEFETWGDGPHGAAGVSCADCHMPYKRVDGKKKISSHLWTSPLRNDEMIRDTCGNCHADKTPAYLRGRVEATQKKTYDQLMVAQDMSVKAHEAVRQAAEWTGEKAPNYDQLMAEAREWVRKGQFFWDYVSAENSVGFHNPMKAMDTLAKSQQYSQNAVNAAMAATNYGIGKTLEGDIHTLVPPILEWSRKMQMEPENLQKHIWTKYLTPLPKAERVWHLQERLPKADAPAAPANVGAK